MGNISFIASKLTISALQTLLYVELKDATDYLHNSEDMVPVNWLNTSVPLS
jgi:hypothetical protein